MERKQPTQNKALMTISGRAGCSIDEPVRQRLSCLAELIRKDGAPYPLTVPLVNLWVDVFMRVRVPAERIKAAFDKAERELTFWPSPAEVLSFLSNAEANRNEEEASQKWQWVRDYIRLHYHPDLGVNRGPRISERCRRAINAAGGLAYLSECSKENLIFARKRFIESYLRWEELQQDEYLLPEAGIRTLLSEGSEERFPQTT
jgi:hypothetical protein